MNQALICVVTGASRGVGRGVALALGASGATVYVTGRSVKEGDSPLPGHGRQNSCRCDGSRRPRHCCGL